jgi:hypothetical protein
MIALSNGSDVRDLLEHVRRRPERHRELIICSPFIDPELDETVEALAAALTTTGGGLLLVTTREAGRGVRARLGGPATRRAIVVTPRRRLHAKAYIAVARRPRESEAIVTSANLTLAGLDTNIELGVRATPSCDAGRDLIAQTSRFVRGLA